MEIRVSLSGDQSSLCEEAKSSEKARIDQPSEEPPRELQTESTKEFLLPSGELFEFRDFRDGTLLSEIWRESWYVGDRWDFCEEVRSNGREWLREEDGSVVLKGRDDGVEGKEIEGLISEAVLAIPGDLIESFSCEEFRNNIN